MRDESVHVRPASNAHEDSGIDCMSAHWTCVKGVWVRDQGGGSTECPDQDHQTSDFRQELDNNDIPAAVEL
eukprot:2995251-Alexandrium_andersonii.AAC.1